MLRCTAIGIPLLLLLAGPPALCGADPPQVGATEKSESKSKSKTKGTSKSCEFQSLFDGRTLKHWQVLDHSDFKRHGKVVAKGGAIELAQGRPASGIVYAGKPPRMNYELSLEARRVAGDDFFLGLTFPYAKEHVTLILGGWGGKATGLSNIDDIAAIENETSSFIDFKNGKWYAIRLRVTEAKIQAWVGKEQVVDLETADHKFSVWWEQEPARPLGLTTWHSAASYRKIRLRRLAAADLKQSPSPKDVENSESTKTPR